MYIQLCVRNGHALLKGEERARFGSHERKIGPWATWDWDGDLLRAAVDRYGFYPIFYAARPDGITISDSISELLMLGASRSFDNAAIAAFLRLGFFIGEDTPFTAIRAFPPNGRLSWQPTPSLIISGEVIVRKPDPGISRSEAVDGYVMRFRSAISRSVPDNPAHLALPLSGGRDSRHIAFELKRLGVQPGVVISQRHFASHNDEDFVVASRLCEAMNWTIVIQEQSSDPLQSEMEKNQIFDCLTDEHAWFLPSAKYMAKVGIQSVFDGIAGDALSNSLFIREPWIELGRTKNFETWFRDMPAAGYGASEDTIRSLLTPARAIDWNWETAFARVNAEFEKFAGDDNPINQFMFWNRTRREIAPFLIRYQPNAEVLTPYLDPDVFDFLWSLPTELLKDHRLHDDAIACAAPEFANIPFESKGPSVDAGRHYSNFIRGMARKRQFWWGGGDVLNRGWLRPRLAASLLRKDFGRNADWYARWASWLVSLEGLAVRGSL